MPPCQWVLHLASRRSTTHNTKCPAAHQLFNLQIHPKLMYCRLGRMLTLKDVSTCFIVVRACLSHIHTSVSLLFILVKPTPRLCDFLSKIGVCCPFPTFLSCQILTLKQDCNCNIPLLRGAPLRRSGGAEEGRLLRLLLATSRRQCRVQQ